LGWLWGVQAVCCSLLVCLRYCNYVLWGPGGAFEVRSRPAEASGEMSL
jgi:hypothetical protein